MAAVPVTMAGLKDGRKVVAAIEPGYRESSESWSALLRDLKARGMSWPCLVIGHGHRGISGAVRNVFPEADEQRWWNHKVSESRFRRLGHRELPPLVYERRFPVHTVEEHQVLEEPAVWFYLHTY